MKSCKACKKERPLEDFYGDHRSSTGRTSNCKECTRQQARDRYQEGLSGGVSPDTLLICSACSKELSANNFYRDGRRATGRQSQCSSCQKQALRSSYRKHPERYLLRNAKRRAKEKGLPFDITEADIQIPTHCPVLGIELGPVRGRHRSQSPSIDQIVPGRGYVQGNVAVISWRANSIKQDATLDELEKLLTWLRQQ